MAHPKRKHSKSRRDKRRTHDKITPIQVQPCSHCGLPKPPHRVCPHCGYYKGRPVLTPY